MNTRHHDTEMELVTLRSRKASAERNARIYYDKLRILENKVRLAVAKCAAASNADEAQDACLALLREIPKHPRLTETQQRQKRHKGMHRKA